MRKRETKRQREREGEREREKVERIRDQRKEKILKNYSILLKCAFIFESAL